MYIDALSFILGFLIALITSIILGQNKFDNNDNDDDDWRV